MSKIQLTSNYTKHMTKNPINKFLINNFYKTLVDLAKPLNPKTILDAGCGEGFSINKLYNEKIGLKFEGIDDSKIALSLGKQLFPHLNLKYGSIRKLPYENNSFDLVICTEVLEHLENPERELAEISRVVKKHILFSVPNEPFFTLQRLIRGKNIMKFGAHPEHIQHWNNKTFEEFLKKNHIKILTKKTPFPWIMILGEKITKKKLLS